MYRILPFFVVLLFSACSTSEPDTGIYYWKSTWELDEAEQQKIQQHGLDRVYLRLFDLDTKGTNFEDRGRILLPDNPDFSEGLTYVPVIFIVNRIWKNGQAPESVARALLARLDYYLNKYPTLRNSDELQIDCDWTALTRDAYFGMLSEVKRQRPGLDLSVTIRLHQYRERTDNGVPPADRGLLMCYNLAAANKWETRDAIYDEDLLRGYLKADLYPLPLDVALPLFRWGAAFRGRKFLGLTDHPEMIDANLFVTEEDGQFAVKGKRYTVQRDTLVNGHFLRPGDVIRGDGIVNTEVLSAARELLVEKTNPRYLLYFDWQEGVLERLPTKAAD
ncbi:hypothetical protein [Lewinella sp. 4G2]|uniref:hypothetical protein n=1 Tax=Lewinella sp. 4G2 TaxID=1803372 RepID=UPI0007B48054|nr:hypothetical protein [Lewinella sp. 4G2]OAV46275.1 hypothetical protein A3850_018640 [Lewinella sp. 4G2]